MANASALIDPPPEFTICNACVVGDEPAAVEKLKSAQIIRAFLAEQRAEAAAAAAAAVGSGDEAAGATSTITIAATEAAAMTAAQAAAVHDSPIVTPKAAEDGGLRMSSTPALTRQGQPAVTPQEALFPPLPPSPQWRPEHEDSEDYGWAYR